MASATLKASTKTCQDLGVIVVPSRIRTRRTTVSVVKAAHAVVARFGGDTNPDTCTRVALALTDKGVALGVLDRHEEAIVNL